MRGTTTQGLHFGDSNTIRQGDVDSNMVGDINSRMIILRYVFTIGGTTIIWISKLQKVVSLLTIEEEYVAAIEDSK